MVRFPLKRLKVNALDFKRDNNPLFLVAKVLTNYYINYYIEIWYIFSNHVLFWVLQNIDIQLFWVWVFGIWFFFFVIILKNNLKMEASGFVVLVFLYQIYTLSFILQPWDKKSYWIKKKDHIFSLCATYLMNFLHETLIWMCLCKRVFHNLTIKYFGPFHGKSRCNCLQVVVACGP